MLKTAPKLMFTAADHGEPVSDWDFEAAEFEPGYKYEIIDGRLYVAAEPDPPEDDLVHWLYRRLDRYSEARPDVIKRVSQKARVYAPPRPRLTIPEPDLACYATYPRHRAAKIDKWSVVNPVIVVEVLVNGDPDKDLNRNVKLYLQVPDIREYWVIDGRIDADLPRLIQHRRLGTRWVVRTYDPGETFTTKLLPGFELLLDPFPS